MEKEAGKGEAGWGVLVIASSDARLLCERKRDSELAGSSHPY